MKLRATVLMIFSLMMVSAQDFTDKARLLEDASSLDPLITAAGDKKLVLLGEASHGTHEYYVSRHYKQKAHRGARFQFYCRGRRLCQSL